MLSSFLKLMKQYLDEAILVTYNLRNGYFFGLHPSKLLSNFAIGGHRRV